jgi:hypothetical protein
MDALMSHAQFTLILLSLNQAGSLSDDHNDGTASYLVMLSCPFWLLLLAGTACDGRPIKQCSVLTHAFTTSWVAQQCNILRASDSRLA